MAVTFNDPLRLPSATGITQSSSTGLTQSPLWRTTDYQPSSQPSFGQPMSASPVNPLLNPWLGNDLFRTQLGFDWMAGSLSSRGFKW